MCFAPCIYTELEKSELISAALHNFKEEVVGYHTRIFEAACKIEPDKAALDKDAVVKEYLKKNPTAKAPQKDLEDAVTRTRVDCLRTSALLKSSAFVEECEWRLVLPVPLDKPPSSMSNPPQFRVGRNTLIPFIAHPIDKHSNSHVPLVDVILGPGSDENSLFAAERFLKSQGLDVIPRLSKVPYRPS